VTPNKGQGAAMAIEDAMTLTAALATGAGGVLGRQVALGHARVSEVQLESRRLGQLAYLLGNALGVVRRRSAGARAPARRRCAIRSPASRCSHSAPRKLLAPGCRASPSFP